MSAASVLFCLKKLPEEYHSNMETLVEYLSLNVENVYQIAQGNMQILPDGSTERTKTLDKMMFLATIPEGLPDLKVEAFLEIILSYRQLSKRTVAKTAGTEIADVGLFPSDQYEKTNAEIKYKIMAITMVLRFLLRDNELKQ